MMKTWLWKHHSDENMTMKTSLNDERRLNDENIWCNDENIRHSCDESITHWWKWIQTWLWNNSDHFIPTIYQTKSSIGDLDNIVQGNVVKPKFLLKIYLMLNDTDDTYNLLVPNLSDALWHWWYL